LEIKELVVPIAKSHFMDFKNNRGPGLIQY